MDTQNAATLDVPNLKLARVGNKREKKRGGGIFGGNGQSLGSRLFASAGGAGGAASGTGFWAPGMSFAKMLLVLLISGGLSAGAWEVGHLMANSSASNQKPSNTKLFADKDTGKYADTSGVIKSKNEIPNSLGYVNNDGLTDEQRAAKKAAEEEAARKAAADAQAKADAEAKAKADADKAAAAQVPAAPPAAAAPDMMKKALTSGSKFGSMSSGFGGGGGGGLSGGAGLSGGINSKFGAMNNMKGQNGALAGFGTGSKPTMSAAQKGTPTPKSGLKGFAAQQLGNAFGATRSALASGQTESAAAGAGAPFDNNPAAGSVISGPGVSNGAQTGAADSAGSPNSSSNSGGPLNSGGGAACSQSGYEPDINGNCQPVQAPPMKSDAAYQGLIDAAMVIMGLVMLLSLIASAIKDIPIYGSTLATVILMVVAALGAALMGIGAKIATMTHGDFMIGAIIGAVGLYISYTALTSWGEATKAAPNLEAGVAAHVLIASALGELAAASTKASSLM